MSPEILVGLAAVLAALAVLIRSLARWTEAQAAKTVANATMTQSQAKAVEVDAAKEAIITDLASRTTTLSSTLQTVLLAQVAGRDREVAAATLNGDLKAQVAKLTAALELQNSETNTLLTRLEQKTDVAVSNSTLANRQLTTVQHTLAVNAQPEDTTVADAALAFHRKQDSDATVGILGPAPAITASAQQPIAHDAPPIVDGVAVVLTGTLSIPLDDNPPKVAQEVPRPPSDEPDPPPMPVLIVNSTTGDVEKRLVS